MATALAKDLYPNLEVPIAHGCPAGNWNGYPLQRSDDPNPIPCPLGRSYPVCDCRERLGALRCAILTPKLSIRVLFSRSESSQFMAGNQFLRSRFKPER